MKTSKVDGFIKKVLEGAMVGAFLAAVIMAAVVFAGCTNLPKPEPCPEPTLVASKDQRVTTGKWILFSKKNFKRRPGQMMAMTAPGGKALPGLNAMVFDKKPMIQLSANSDLVLQPEYVHTIRQQPVMITPYSCPTRPECPTCPTQPGPGPSPNPNPINDTIPYGIAMVHGVEAQALVANLSSQTLCVADTGINASHPDFAGIIVGTRSFVGGTAADGQGHGSHVAGTALAIARNGGVVGVAGGAKLLAAKVLGDNGSGGSAGIAQGIVWCADSGAGVINLSLGSNMRDPAMDQATSYAISKGVTVVVAAGNSGRAIQGSPAQAPGVIVATAIDRNGRPASFTSFGPEADFYLPGVDIVSASHRGSGMATMSGTSMSSPHLAGIALIAKAVGKAIGFINGNLPSQYGKGMADALATVQQ